ncbi:Ig-like domain-containing protein [Polluticaenibacter yanchengensis]|uniref:Ig-like domain-containing protein n=1 Tax=Polluticaenibacter yanchengensis TaxID=3014562 RepID=A0ABT4UNV0_9BACT|nr:Ig-like domain-containing protein [Chitinophagaceae bacterium LY-5]
MNHSFYMFSFFQKFSRKNSNADKLPFLHSFKKRFYHIQLFNHCLTLTAFIVLTCFNINNLNAQTTITSTSSIHEYHGYENLNAAGDFSSFSVAGNSGDYLGRQFRIGIKFSNINIPKGATITNAYIKFRANATKSGALTQRIYAEDIDQPASFTGNASSTPQISQRTRTAVSVDWPISETWTSGQYYNTVNIASVAQVIVNRPGWVPNNAMLFAIEPTDNSNTNNRNIWFFWNAGYSPELVITYILCSPVTGSPTFALGSSSSRCQGAGTVQYTASEPTTTNISYSLDAASVAAGNSISTSGVVTYTASWSGTSVITATATGCGSPTTATHTVSHTPITQTPVFATGIATKRCVGAEVASYPASAVGAISYTYTINNIGAGTQPTINATTGQVNYPANWVGQSTISVQANGCSNTASNSINITTTTVIANNDSYAVVSGVPTSFNVLSNDKCGFDASTVSVVQQPSQGILQQSSNGNFTFTALGSYTGPLSFQYQVCNSGSGVCDVATVTFDITTSGNADPCTTANMDKLFYMPFPENTSQLLSALRSAGNDATNNTANVRNITSFSIPYPSTIIVYDHWEDGYEADINNPAQSTTQIWGDGILSNGVAPGTTNDLIPAGFTIALDNTFAYARTTANIVYDGKDKVYTSNEVAITKVSGSTATFEIQSVKTNVIDVSKFGNVYVLPFGEDIPAKYGINTPVFRYTGLFARAIENGTVITLTIPNTPNPLVVTSPVLNEGEVWYYGGTATMPGSATSNVNQTNDLKAGTIISSTKKFGVDMLFGGIDNFGTRNIPLYPAEWYGNEYLTPVYSTVGTSRVFAYFVNPNPGAITINWNKGTGATGSFTVPGNGGISRFQLDAATGTHFVSQGKEPFQGIVIVDDNAPASATGVSNSLNYDWAYTLLPINRLTNFSKLGWAPGTSDLSANYNPIWVTAKTATTIYVKYNGNVTSGVNQSPCGAYYDIAYPMGALEVRKIKIGNDNTGAAIFNCDNVPMSVAWGQEPGSTTPTGAPAMDVGYTVDGLCLSPLVFAKDDYDTTGIGTPVTINVSQNDNGFLVGLDPTSVSTQFLTQPANGTIIVNPNGTITYTPNFGFSGNDHFEYRICANAPQANSCDVATVHITVNCGFAADANIISGIVYSDVNNNLQADNGDFPKQGVVVNIYKDNGMTGIFEPATDLLVASVTSDVNSKYSTSVTTLRNVKDDFNANAINNNNGNDNWGGNWTAVGSLTLTSTSSIVNLTGGYLQVGIGTTTTQFGASRLVNLSGKTKALLTYNWDKSTFTNDANDWVEVQVSSNGSGWTTLYRFTGLPAQNGSHNFDISNFISATTTIRFVEPNNATTGTGKYVRFDNVEVKYFETGNYIVRPAVANPVANPQQHLISFNGSNESNCDNNFGYALPLDLGNLPIAGSGEPIIWPQATASLFSLDQSNTNRVWLGGNNSYPNQANASNVDRNGGLTISSDDIDVFGLGTKNNPFSFTGFNWRTPSFDLSFNITVNGNATSGNKIVYYGLWFDANGNGNFTDADDIFVSGSREHGSPVTVSVPVKFMNGGSNIGASGGAIRLVATKEDNVFTKAQNGIVNVTNGEVEDYYVTYPLPLPVNLKLFTAIKKSETAVLNWTTASENNNKGFDVERSADGIIWQSISFVASAANEGNSNLPLSYSLIDSAPNKGVNYYRLKQTDLNGKFEYSVIRQLYFGESLSLVRIYPNPATTEIAIAGVEVGSTIRIDNPLGKTVVASIKTADLQSNINLNISYLPSGIYLIVITGKDGKSSTHKLIKD